MKLSSELAQDRRAWSSSVRDVINAIGADASVIMPTTSSRTELAKSLLILSFFSVRFDFMPASCPNKPCIVFVENDVCDPREIAIKTKNVVVEQYSDGIDSSCVI